MVTVRDQRPAKLRVNKFLGGSRKRCVLDGDSDVEFNVYANGSLLSADCEVDSDIVVDGETGKAAPGEDGSKYCRTS